MATLNLSTNGQSIRSSYQKVVDGPAPSGASASSPTYGQWALFSVQAPLVSAFQQESGKESVLRVQTTGEGELLDLIEDFSEGRIQFGFCKVKDPNSGLPKSVLIAWCGEGVPERTKGYFGSHLAAVSKLLHGYHIQITARSDRDLTPDGIIQKVADSSGSKYGGGPATTQSSGPAPPVASKPFMPSKVGGAGGFNPLGGRSRAQQSTPTNDGDGWGEDAPQVTRSQLEKVESAYKPTKVNMAELTSQKQAPSRFQPPQSSPSNGSSDVVRGGYQPIGKVDIAAIRKQAQEQGQNRDERPTAVKGSYEPIGKVDIAAIRAKASAGPAPSAPPPSQSTGDDERPQSLADRSAAFQSSGRMSEMPKPKVANRFGSQTSAFTGTKPLTPGGFEGKPLAGAAPVGTASRTFADEGGKTPAQLWAEKKARQRGESGASQTQSPVTPTVQPQQSGGWQSGYGGKKWGDVQTNKTGASNISANKTGEQDVPEEEPEQERDGPAAGGVSSIANRFKDSAPMGSANVDDDEFSEPPAPRMDMSSKPNAGVRGVPMPGLPQRPAAPQPHEVPEEHPDDEHVSLPPPPPRQIPRDEDEEEEEEDDMPTGSPPRIAMPVSRTAQPAEIETHMPPPMPAAAVARVAEEADPEPEPQQADEEAARGASHAAAETTFGAGAASAAPGASTSGKRAIVQYDYEKAEENELELHEGEHVTNIEMVDEDWWMGTNSQGESGLFPSNYVELVEGEEDEASSGGAAGYAPAEQEEDAVPAAGPPGGSGGGATAIAQYDYEAAEENELSFPDGATITNIEFPDEDWWLGEYNGNKGLFPANYVVLEE